MHYGLLLSLFFSNSLFCASHNSTPQPPEIGTELEVVVQHPSPVRPTIPDLPTPVISMASEPCSPESKPLPHLSEEHPSAFKQTTKEPSNPPSPQKDTLPGAIPTSPPKNNLRSQSVPLMIHHPPTSRLLDFSPACDSTASSGFCSASLASRFASACALPPTPETPLSSRKTLPNSPPTPAWTYTEPQDHSTPKKSRTPLLHQKSTPNLKNTLQTALNFSLLTDDESMLHNALRCTPTGTPEARSLQKELQKTQHDKQAFEEKFTSQLTDVIEGPLKALKKLIKQQQEQKDLPTYTATEALFIKYADLEEKITSWKGTGLDPHIARYENDLKECAQEIKKIPDIFECHLEFLKRLIKQQHDFPTYTGTTALFSKYAALKNQIKNWNDTDLNPTFTKYEKQLKECAQEINKLPEVFNHPLEVLKDSIRQQQSLPTYTTTATLFNKYAALKNQITNWKSTGLDPDITRYDKQLEECAQEIKNQQNAAGQMHRKSLEPLLECPEAHGAFPERYKACRKALRGFLTDAREAQEVALQEEHKKGYRELLSACADFLTDKQSEERKSAPVTSRDMRHQNTPPSTLEAAKYCLYPPVALIVAIQSLTGGSTRPRSDSSTSTDDHAPRRPRFDSECSQTDDPTEITTDDVHEYDLARNDAGIEDDLES